MEELTDALEAAQASINPQHEALEEATAALEALLAGAEDVRARREQLRAQLEQGRERLVHLEQAIESHDELCKQRDKQAQLKRRHASKARELEKERELLEAARDSAEELDAQLTQRRQTHRQLERALVLSDHRAELDEQEPCPLCGSEHHPYLGAARDEDDHEAELRARHATVEDELGALEAKIEAQRERTQELDRNVARLESARAEIETQRDELDDEFDALLKRYNAARVVLKAEHLEVFPGARDAQKELREAFVEQRGARKLEIQRLEQKLEALGEAYEAVQARRDQMQQARKQTRELEQQHDRHQTRLQTKRADLAERESDLEEAAQGVERAATALRERFEEAGVACEVEEDGELRGALAGALERARVELEAYQKLRAELEERVEQKRQTEQPSARPSTAARRPPGAPSAPARRTPRVAEGWPSSRSRPPAARGARPEGGHRRARGGHRGRQADARGGRGARDARREAASKLEAQLEERRRQIAHAEEVLAEARAQLDARLEELELELEALREGLLEAQERARLEDEIGQLEQDARRAKEEIERLEGQLQAHTEEQPELDDEYDDDDDDLEVWAERGAKLREERDALLEELGARRKEVKLQEEATRKAAGWRDELEQKREEYRTWETIHRLIGVRDGDSFKQFAQSLNLQELVDRANLRLERLAPRYALAVASGEHGEPLLDFVVRDHHQADAERPLTTLSGGETFLVSLALALALSDFRRIDMPVETLLLDEGFGTLDQDSLSVAINTLRQLQQESVQQIGIISHVETLREWVDSRVLVKKLGNGRSEIRIDQEQPAARGALMQVTRTNDCGSLILERRRCLVQGLTPLHPPARRPGQAGDLAGHADAVAPLALDTAHAKEYGVLDARAGRDLDAVEHDVGAEPDAGGQRSIQAGEDRGGQLGGVVDGAGAVDVQALGHRLGHRRLLEQIGLGQAPTRRLHVELGGVQGGPEAIHDRGVDGPVVLEHRPVQLGQDVPVLERERRDGVVLEQVDADEVVLEELVVGRGAGAAVVADALEDALGVEPDLAGLIVGALAHHEGGLGARGAVAGQVLGQLEVHDAVAVQTDQRALRLAQRLPDAADAAGGAQQLPLARVDRLQVELGADAVDDGGDGVGEVVEVAADVGDAGAGEVVEGVGDQRGVEEGQQRLGQRVGQGAHAGAEPGAQHGAEDGQRLIVMDLEAPCP